MTSAAQFSRSVVSHSLRPHGLQQARLPWLHRHIPTPKPIEVTFASEGERAEVIQVRMEGRIGRKGGSGNSLCFHCESRIVILWEPGGEAWCLERLGRFGTSTKGWSQRGPGHQKAGPLQPEAAAGHRQKGPETHLHSVTWRPQCTQLGASLGPNSRWGRQVGKERTNDKFSRRPALRWPLLPRSTNTTPHCSCRHISIRPAKSGNWGSRNKARPEAKRKRENKPKPSRKGKGELLQSLR